jgi:hypothetical protein
MKINFLFFSLLFFQTIYAEGTSIMPTATFQFTAESSEPLYQTVASAALYQYSLSGSLRDIRITNGNGEQVPYAVMPYRSLHPEKIQTESSQLLKFIEIGENKLNESDLITIQLDRQANQTTLNLKSNAQKTLARPVYLIDLGQKPQPLQNLTLDWLGNENVLIPLELLASDNLKDWAFIEQIVLLKSRQNGQSVVNNRINLVPAITSRYLQLRPDAKFAGEFKLTKAATTYRQDAVQVLPYQWTTLRLMERQEKETGMTALVYEIDGRYPVSQLRISLPEENTITSVSISMKNTEKDNWRPLISTMIFRINQNGYPAASPDIFIPETVARYWRLQFDQNKGGIGKENPILAAAWLPHTLVWNARGKGPFQLTTGNSAERTNSVAITDLISVNETVKVLDLPSAALNLQAKDIQVSKKIAQSWFAELDYKPWLLWAGLVMGVMFLAWMAYSLLNPNHRKNH